MINVRRFSLEGIKTVRSAIDSHLTEMRKGLHGIPVSSDELNKIIHLAYEEEMLEPQSLSVKVDPGVGFKSSYDLGKYLCNRFMDMEFDASDSGLWTWVAVIYLAQLLERNKDNKFLLGRSYRYVLDNDNRLRYYRHLVFMPYYLVHRLDDQALVFLHSPLHVSGEFLAQAQKDEVISNRNLVAMCQKYFFDSANGKFARGFTGKSSDPNSLRRLVESLIPQLSINFDTRYCSPDEIFSMLPDDFCKFAFTADE